MQPSSIQLREPSFTIKPQPPIVGLSNLVAALHVTRIRLADARRQRDNWRMAFTLIAFFDVLLLALVAAITIHN